MRERERERERDCGADKCVEISSAFFYCVGGKKKKKFGQDSKP